MSLLIRNGRVVTADSDSFADVYVEGEKVALIGHGIDRPADEVVDATGKLVIPGGIDPHTHLDMPFGGTMTADDFATGTLAAAFGGTTTVVDFAIQKLGRSALEGLDAWHEKADGKATIDYGFHMILTDVPEDRIDEMDALAEKGVTSYKMFMAYPGSLYTDDGTRFRAFTRAGRNRTLVMMHAENGIVIDELTRRAAREGRLAPRWHGLTRPTAMAGEAVYRAAIMAEMAGVPLYIVHMNCVEDLDEMRRARARGVDVCGEICPQYLFLDESILDTEGFEGAKYVLSPPLRPKCHQEPLWRGLLLGDFDTTATDHAPFNYRVQKELGLGDFRKIPNGMPGIENRMSLMFHGGVVQRGMSINDFVALTSTNAAKIFGMFPRKGTIAVGSDADLVVFDPNRRETVSVANPFTHHMNVDYTAYEGMELQGWSEVVVSRGRVICRDGALVTRGGGRYVARARYRELLR